MSASAAGSSRASAGAVAVDAAIGVVVTALLLAGLARPGFPLLRDWVATPMPPLSDAALGLGESAARAVPQDVAMVWASRAPDAVGLPVWPLTGLLTAAFCVWLAVAAGALVRMALPASRPASADSTADSAADTAAGTGSTTALWLRLPAVVGAVWNPFVVERLLQGHWSLLAGVAAVMTMPVLLARPRSSGVRIVAACTALAAAGLTPTGWLLATLSAIVALTVTAVRRGRAVAVAGAAAALGVTALITALPWLLATIFAGAGGEMAGGDSAGGVGATGQAVTGVAAFAARAEPGIGTLGSVFALGGIWNSEAVPPSRATLWAAAALVLLLFVWAIAAPGLWRARHAPVVLATIPIAVATWLVVAAAATGPGIAVLDAVVSAVPAAGLLRDSQKFVALALPATVLALAFATRASARWLRPVGATIAVMAVVLAAVPDAPRALWNQLRPVTYGPGWAEVAEIVDGEPGDLLVLPAGSFRATPLWADGRAVLDPAPRLLDTRVLVPGDLLVGGASGGSAESVAGEGDRARRATEALLRGDATSTLSDLGVRWVLDERTSAGPRGESARTLGENPTTTTRFSDSELILHELPWPNGQDDPATTSAVHSNAAPAASSTDRGLVLAAHALWLLTFAGVGAFALVGVGVGVRGRSGVPGRSGARRS